MSDSLPLKAFLEAPGIILDARSPAEFKQGCIPGSSNLPLLDNVQRALVGTAYKQEGRDKAVELGFKLVGPDFAHIIAKGRKLADGGPAKVCCWRGGMRSQTLAWLLNTAGIPTIVLQGGYKSFRQHAIQVLQTTAQFNVVGGLTGSGKTEVLHALRELGEQVVDLEALARHRGSSFGMLGQPAQPSQEQFENELAWGLEHMEPTRPIWIEHESRMIGRRQVPTEIFAQMLGAPLFVMERPMHERVALINRDYGQFSPQQLREATQRITKKLGGLRTKQALELIEAGRAEEWIPILLDYYDRTYETACRQHVGPVQRIKAESWSSQEWAKALLVESQPTAAAS